VYLKGSVILIVCSSGGRIKQFLRDYRSVETLNVGKHFVQEKGRSTLEETWSLSLKQSTVKVLSFDMANAKLLMEFNYS